MKKMSKAISVVLVLCMLVSTLGLTSFAAGDFKTKLQNGVAKGIEAIFNGVFGAVNLILPDGETFYDINEYKDEQFFSGNETFLDAPAEGAQWMLGSSEISLVPDDWKEYDYFLGGYIMLENGMNNRVEEILDDMRARVIAISDNTDRGVAVFATIDSIGLTNQDIREIRAKLVEKAGDDFDFSGISVSSTHCHSGIDTEGLWTNIFGKAVKNLFKAVTRIGKLDQGTDPKYMEFLYDKVSDAMLAACKEMVPGTMTFAQKDIGDDYFGNKNRPSASALITDMTRFVFTPDVVTKENRPTMIVNVAAHPDVAGLPTNDNQGNGRGISGDFIYYMGETINGAGYDFMYFSGAIAGIYMARGATNNGQVFTHRVQQSERYGNELGRIALSLTLTEEQIIADDYITNDEREAAEREVAEKNGGKYLLWYEGWEPVTEKTLAPVFNVAFKEVDVHVTNSFIKIAGKLKLANYDILKDGREYYVRTEIGYMEIGDIKIALMPGEVCQDLVVGGTSLEAETAFRGEDFNGKTIVEIFGEGTVAFGLMNDAIGYVIPDNDYCMSVVFNHYHELISLGDETASTIMAAFEELAEEIK
ncbi:MAG: hypothetical protein IJB86_09230 [Clostridia bacterium]|nr:hypothetical protein [Clostridia bacterium]